MNEPIGRFGSCRPARARRTAVETASTASPWPTTRLPSVSSMRSSLSRSPSSIRSTGTPVQRETTWAIWSGVTASSTIAPLPSSPSIAFSFFSRPGISPYCSSPARPRSPRRWACASSVRRWSSSTLSFWASPSLPFSFSQRRVSVLLCSSSSAIDLSSFASRSLEAASLSFFSASRSIFICMRSRSMASSSSGLESISIRRREAASSIRSMALSGRKRSEM